MKYLLTFLLVLILGILGYGFYLKSLGNINSELIIGLSVSAIAFIYMPLFIYHRYKNKKISDFTFEKFKKDLENRSK
ncbi:hypothetical protein [Lutibacter sp.]